MIILKRDYSSFGKTLKVDGVGYLLSEDIANFINRCDLKNLSNQTIRNYSGCLKRLFEWFEMYHIDCTTDTNKITEHHIEEFLHFRKARISVNSLNLDVRTLHLFFEYLYNNKRIKFNPTQNLKNVKVDKPIRKIVSESEFKKLTLACDLNSLNGIVSYTLLYTLMYTGIRLGEIARLKIHDVDIPNKRIMIQKAKNRQGRIIPIHNKLERVLTAYLNVRKDFRGDSFFVTIRETPLSDRIVQWKIEKVVKEAGLKDISCHSFRRTFITNMLKNGTDVISLSAITGHTNIGQLQTYAQLDVSHLQNVIQNLE